MFYGYKKIAGHIRWKYGLNVTDKVIYRYTERLNIKSKPMKRGPKKPRTIPQENFLLDSQGKTLFRPGKSNKQWSIDITDIKYKNRKTIKLTAIIDHNDNTKNIIVQSDLGVEFTSFKFDKRLSDWESVNSHSRKGTPTDNAPIENFYKYLKREIDLKFIKTLEFKGAVKAIDDYIHYWNNGRVQTVLGDKPPIEFLKEKGSKK